MAIRCYWYISSLPLDPRAIALTRSDIDEKNLHCARDNIMRNKLQHRIRPFKVRPDGPLFPLDDFGLDRYNLTFDLGIERH